jgi:tRNA-dihydrouridine synthase A
MPIAPSSNLLRWRVCIAPMLDWTDRHCRFFHRLLSKQALLYTEMVTTGALIHGNPARHLQFNPQEQPLALQLGGSEPTDLATCARMAARWGYSEVNLNCGCPSERVQRGAFGACLMNEPQLVADCVRAMVDAVDIPITVKHRIGLDQIESYDFVRDFVGRVSQAGCGTFIVHARNAWLKGLSPKDNREIPPLRYDWAYRLKRDFPNLVIVLNGGINTTEQALAHLQQLDGVMLGRGAYHNPWWISQWDQTLFGQTIGACPSAAPLRPDRHEVEQDMVDYMTQQHADHGVHWSSIARHMLGLRHGLPGARHWRRVWSDHKLKHLPPQLVMALARGAQVS